MLGTRPTRERSCSDCGKVETVRLDNPALRCRKCGCKEGAAAAGEAQKARFARAACGHCGKSIRGWKKFCSRECMRAWQHTDQMAPLPMLESRVSSQLELSRAAEYLVCADLILQGFPAFPSAQGMPYDVLADLGYGVIRIQVKATRGPKSVHQRTKYTPMYHFEVRRCGRAGRKVYKPTDFDVYALVALDVKVIAYMAVSDRILQTIHLRPLGFSASKSARRQECIGDFPFEKVVEAFGIVRPLSDPGDVV